MELTKAQLLQIDDYIFSCGIKYYDVRSEIVDHFANILEEKLAKNPSFDFKNEIIVSYKGAVPNLFAEGKGVVAEGKLKDKNFFIADRILAKHDENYMPPELENILKNNVK